MIKAGTQENLAFRLFCFSYKLRKIPPFREYALPLKPERGQPAKGLRQSLRMTFVMLSVSMPYKNNAAGEVNFPAA